MIFLGRLKIVKGHREDSLNMYCTTMRRIEEKSFKQRVYGLTKRPLLNR